MAWRALRFLSVMSAALSTGVLFGTRVSLGPSTRTFAPTTYVEVQQATVQNLRPVMGVLLPGAVVANAVLLGLVARRGRGAAVGLTAAGLASQLTALGLTVAYELPINKQVLTWGSADLPADWAASRDRWDTVHTWRTAASVVGLACLTSAGLADGDQRVTRTAGRGVGASWPASGAGALRWIRRGAGPRPGRRASCRPGAPR